MRLMPIIWLGRHLLPSAKLTFSSQWSHKTFHFSYMKFLFIKVLVLEKKIQDGTSKIRSRSIGSAVHHFNPYTTEDLLKINGLL